MYIYAITVKKNDNPYLSDYDRYFENLQKSYPKADMQYMFEYGDSNCLHAHGRIHSPTKIYRNQVRPKGWGFDFDIEKYPKAWNKYWQKNAKHQNTIIAAEEEKERLLTELHQSGGDSSPPEESVAYDTDESLCDMYTSMYDYPNFDIRKIVISS